MEKEKETSTIDHRLSMSVADAVNFIVDQEDEIVNTKTKKEMYLNPEQEDFKNLVDNMEEKLGSGRIESLFQIGYEEDGRSMNLTEEEFQKYYETIEKLCKVTESDVSLLRKVKTEEGFVGDVLVRKKPDLENLLEVRVAVVGNVDAGKSTMLGVLTRGILDNGRGKARLNMFRHKHEEESGRTSSISHEIMGFTSKGDICNYTSSHKIDWTEVCKASSKVVTFIDLCGHERYLKTTVFGLTGCSPDFVMLMIGANQGMIGMAKEHLGLALALNVPIFMVVTKIDMCPENVLQETLQQLNKILRSNNVRKMPIFVNSVEDVITCTTNFVSQRLCPIFQVSNVTGKNLDLIRTFLNLLPSYKNFDSTAPAEFLIDDVFLVPGVGTVVAGTLQNGSIRTGDTLLLGPDSLGNFTPVQIKSCQRKRVNVDFVSAGHSASFALKKVKRSEVRKGMVLVAKEVKPKACYEFDAEVLVLFHSTTISTRYQAMTHCGNVRQTAGIINMDKEVLRTGDRSKVRFRFIKQPEYIKAGTRILFREGRTKGVGKVLKPIPIGSPEELRSASSSNM